MCPSPTLPILFCLLPLLSWRILNRGIFWARVRCTRQSRKQSLTHLKTRIYLGSVLSARNVKHSKCSTPAPKLLTASAKHSWPCGCHHRQAWWCKGGRERGTETEITGRKGREKGFTGKVSEERWRQKEHWVPRHKGTNESDAFWELELFSFFRNTGCLWGRPADRAGNVGRSGTCLATLQRRLV